MTLNTAINPILPGTYPDPSIVVDGDTCWLVTSTFEYFPGLPIFRSDDLTSWTQVGHAIDRFDQVDLSMAKSSKGLFAPTLRKNGDIWYLICTLVGGDDSSANFILTATDPAGPWSQPVWLESAPGIDPSLFFDADGRIWYTGTYLVEDGDWPGQTAVWLQEIDRSTLQLMGERHVIWNGALLGAVWAEGPHIYKKDDWYYLLASEGGTEFNHALSVARSRSVAGPYIGSPANPVITHRHLGHDYPVTNVGHADLFVTADGTWGAVLLASRPYGGYFANLGRETFVVDVVWEDDWPVFAPGVGVVSATPQESTAGPVMPEELQWTQAGSAVDGFWRVDVAGRTVSIDSPASSVSPGGRSPFVGVRQRHRNFSFGATIESRSSAAIRVRQSDDVWMAAELHDGLLTVRTSDGELTEVATHPAAEEAISIDVTADGQEYSFGVTSAEGRTSIATVNGSFLSSQAAGGFVGVWVGFTSTDSGDTTKFTDVFYQGFDDDSTVP